jgi:hypothetical protein
MFATRTGGTWSAAAAIGSALILAGDRPALAAGPGGAVMLAFRATDGKLYWTQYSGGSWSAPAPLQAGGVGASAAPALAPGMSAFAYELGFLDGGGAAYHARFVGGAWTTPSLVGGTGLTGIALASGSCSSAP